MNVTEAIFARRAVRAYTPEMINAPTLRSLLRSAVQAPSAMNRQPWLFSIIQDVELLKRYSDRAKTLLLAQTSRDAKTGHYQDLLKDPGFNIFYGASTLVAIGTGERGTYTDADCWLAAENLMLAAYGVGLGSCCIGFAIPILNTPEVKAELRMPLEGAFVAPVILGYAAAEPSPVPRNDPKIISWSAPVTPV